MRGQFLPSVAVVAHSCYAVIKLFFTRSHSSPSSSSSSLNAHRLKKNESGENNIISHTVQSTHLCRLEILSRFSPVPAQLAIVSVACVCAYLQKAEA